MMPGISYAHGVSDTALLSETIGTNLRSTTATFGDKEALVDFPSGRRWTYLELLHWVTGMAQGLRQRGIEKGDRVGIWSPNCPEWVAVQYATAMIGAILVNINPAYRQSELEYVLQQSGARMLVSADTIKGTDYRSMVHQAAQRVPCLTDVTFIGDESWHDFASTGSGSSDHEIHGIESTLSFDDPINIQYTSGTTGFPKGATLSHHNILNNAYWVARTPSLYGIRSCVSTCALLPLLRHGDGQSGHHHPRRHNCHSGSAL